MLGQPLRIRTVRQYFPHQEAQHGVVRARGGSQMAGGKIRGFRAAGVDDPDLAPIPDRLDGGGGRQGHGGGVPVGDHRVHAHVDQQLDIVEVRPAIEAREATHLTGHQHLRRAVDGQGTEFRRRADRPVKQTGQVVTGGVHSQAATEIDPHRPRAVLVDDAAQLPGQIVQAIVPVHRLMGVPLFDQRPFQTLLVVVHLRQGPPLGAGIAPGLGMLPIPPYPHHLIPLLVHENAAQGRADPAETALGVNGLFIHDFYSPDLGHDRPGSLLLSY